MGFLRRMASILGFLHGAADDGDGGEDDGRAAGKGEAQSPTPAARKGFGVQVPVPAPRPQAGPVLVPCDPGEGGVQGLKWYGKRLRVDEDGDVADEFLDDLLPKEALGMDNHRVLPTFKLRHSTQPAAVRDQIIVADGSVRHIVEHKGRLLRA
uniref:Eye-specific diacylglycerol kinase n=1 Tax=Anthurium amnicola TaxID=1678845 RepID=A0A1D1YIK7_9ARAE